MKHASFPPDVRLRLTGRVPLSLAAMDRFTPIYEISHVMRRRQANQGEDPPSGHVINTDLVGGSSDSFTVLHIDVTFYAIGQQELASCPHFPPGVRPSFQRWDVMNVRISSNVLTYHVCKIPSDSFEQISNIRSTNIWGGQGVDSDSSDGLDLGMVLLLVFIFYFVWFSLCGCLSCFGSRSGLIYVLYFQWFLNRAKLGLR